LRCPQARGRRRRVAAEVAIYATSPSEARNIPPCARHSRDMPMSLPARLVPRSGARRASTAGGESSGADSNQEYAAVLFLPCLSKYAEEGPSAARVQAYMRDSAAPYAQRHAFAKPILIARETHQKRCGAATRPSGMARGRVAPRQGRYARLRCVLRVLRARAHAQCGGCCFELR